MDANIIWGTSYDNSLNDEMRVAVIATGFDTMNAKSGMAMPGMGLANPDLGESAMNELREDEEDDIDSVFSIFSNRDTKKKKLF